jgi:Family of unknown function (DUF6152)
MTPIKTAAIAVLAAALVAPGVAGAHHGVNKEYDQDKKVVLHGIITKVAWINPHIFFTVVTEEAGQTKTYKIESVPIAFARRAGVTQKDLMGDGKMAEVTITPSRVDPLMGFSSLIRFSSGHTISFAGFKE